MRNLIPGLILKKKHNIDFSLVPLAIIVIEFSVFITQLSSEPNINFGNLILLRVIHTIAMITFASLVSQLYRFLKMPALSYQTLAITAILVLIPGDIIHGYFASVLEIELVSIYRRIGIVLIQGSFWFPAMMIVLGYRREIIEQFKVYGQRLITETRLRSRTSDEFRTLGKEIQLRVRKELYELCSALKDSLANARNSSGTLLERNLSIRAILAGEGLRQFSRRLESFQDIKSRPLFNSKDQRSLILLAQQFRVLYVAALLKAPLGTWAYVTVLIALATPPFIYFHSFRELLFSIPLLVFLILISASIIRRIQRIDSTRARILSSAVIFLSGGLPFAIDSTWQIINPDPQVQVPPLVTAVALPLTYFLFMEVFQVLRPRALRLIENNDLRAGKALQNQVTKTVTAEFSHNLSHQWAIFIHGKILTRLAATALKLETLAKQENSKAFDETLDTLESLLADPAAEFDETPRDLQAEVNTRLQPWQGLLEINLFIDPTLQSVKNSRVRDLGEVMEELLSNSIRHGKAKKIDLKLVPSGKNEIEIISTDDSTVEPPAKSQNAGLGTRIFNLASDGRWSITRQNSATEFRLTMAM
jgi:two-component sensor histidine kinase